MSTANHPPSQVKGREGAPQSLADNNVLSSLKHILVVLGTSIVVFVAFRNSITEHAQNFWGASADFWEALWAKVVNGFIAVFGVDSDLEFNMIVYGTTAVGFVVYWIFGLMYTSFDVTLKPETLRKYKIQPGTNEPVETSRLLKVVAQVLFNQIVVGFLSVLVFYYCAKWRGISIGPKLPHFEQVLLEMVIFVLVEEVAFYYSHRALHHRSVYKYIHKQHHEWTAPIAVTAIYCHPIEHVLSNLFPPFIGVILVGPHLATVWLWFTLATLNTLNAHCGYHFPFLPSPESHDFHHLKFNQCYGVLGVLDRLHGTDTVFRASKAYNRNIMLLSLAPARELYPDDEKPKCVDMRKEAAAALEETAQD
ncbi:unnamed protein product [Cyprideis torosa]|uniref:Uncharacterized protein n=1 Tax=Cyprideis torosa TaxID=163714 RepID=A0A7R8ZM98_9CRUS|nr:unnamed protein product [Cyprideis torosa]CAG0895066.1 unnamed protein product [Cyprideis torosa]